jgi:hypothetical protein
MTKHAARIMIIALQVIMKKTEDKTIKVPIPVGFWDMIACQPIQNP